MPYLSIGKERFYYETEGKDSMLFWIRGYSCDLSLWNGIREELARDFLLVLFDHQEVGKTEDVKGAFAIETMAENMLGIVESYQAVCQTVRSFLKGGE